MNLDYHPRPFESGWNREALSNGRSFGILAATICWFVALWLKSGIALASCTVVGGLVLGVLLRARSGRIAIVADDRQVRSIGWGAELRWPWDAIASFDYVPRRWHCTPTNYSIGTFYTGCLTLTNGATHAIPALIGSSAGEEERDAVNCRILRDLGAYLSRRDISETGTLVCKEPTEARLHAAYRDSGGQTRPHD